MTILKKVVGSEKKAGLETDVLHRFTDVRGSKEGIITAGTRLFQHIYGDKDESLGRLRFLAYNKMVAKSNANPARLPPTIGSATEHILRAYLQFHNWVMLDTRSKNPEDYGWSTTEENVFEPVSSMHQIAPDSLLKFVCCQCSMETEEPCSGRCSCRKYGFHCLPACGNCHGLGCTNSVSNEAGGQLDNIDER